MNNSSEQPWCNFTPIQQVSWLKTFTDNLENIAFGCQQRWRASHPASPAATGTALSERRREFHLMHELKWFYRAERFFRCQWDSTRRFFMCCSWAVWAKWYPQVCRGQVLLDCGADKCISRTRMPPIMSPFLSKSTNVSRLCCKHATPAEFFSLILPLLPPSHLQFVEPWPLESFCKFPEASLDFAMLATLKGLKGQCASGPAGSLSKCDATLFVFVEVKLPAL